MISVKSKFKKILNFLREVRLEMKRIAWLSVKETFKYTLIVLCVSVLVAIILGGIDFLLTKALNKFIL